MQCGIHDPHSGILDIYNVHITSLHRVGLYQKVLKVNRRIVELEREVSGQSNNQLLSLHGHYLCFKQIISCNILCTSKHLDNTSLPGLRGKLN